MIDAGFGGFAAVANNAPTFGMVAGGPSFESFASGPASPAFGGATFPQSNQQSFGG